MPEGGNWKDLLKASGNGDIKMVQYHLNNGVDPNYQHPEYFTSPVFEAIRGGQVQVLDILLGHGGGGSLTALTEESTDLTPLEIAMNEGKHDVVDLLLTKLSRKESRLYCKCIGIPLYLYYDEKLLLSPLQQQICQKLLTKGHSIKIVFNKQHLKADQEDMKRFVEDMKKTTGNQKLETVSSINDLVVGEIDVLFKFFISNSDDNKWVEQSTQEYLERPENSNVRLVLVFNDDNGSSLGHQQMALLKSMPLRCTAIQLYMIHGGGINGHNNGG